MVKLALLLVMSFPISDTFYLYVLTDPFSDELTSSHYSEYHHTFLEKIEYIILQWNEKLCSKV
jgi:hypothetical protein